MHDNSDNPPPDDEVSEGAHLTGSEHSIEREQPAVSADSSLLWNSRFGQGVSRLSQPHLRAAVRRFQGDLVVWAGSQPSACQVLDNCMVRNRLYMGLGNTIPTPVHNSSDMVMFSRVEELPLPSRSVDGVVLHHALEQAEDPRTALREVTRVLMPGGRLVHQATIADDATTTMYRISALSMTVTSSELQIFAGSALATESESF